MRLGGALVEFSKHPRLLQDNDVETFGKGEAKRYVMGFTPASNVRLEDAEARGPPCAFSCIQHEGLLEGLVAIPGDAWEDVVWKEAVDSEFAIFQAFPPAALMA